MRARQPSTTTVADVRLCRLVPLARSPARRSVLRVSSSALLGSTAALLLLSWVDEGGTVGAMTRKKKGQRASGNPQGCDSEVVGGWVESG